MLQSCSAASAIDQSLRIKIVMVNETTCSGKLSIIPYICKDYN